MSLKKIKNSTKLKNFFYLFSCIAWNDSNACLKACLLAGPVVRHLTSENLIPQHLAAVILTRVLQGLQHHGHHDANQVKLKEFYKYFKLIIFLII